MDDLISRKQAIDGKISIQCANGVEIYSDEAVPVEYLKALPSAQPEQRWIPCSERLPEVSYDTLGNWSGDSVLLVFKDGHYDIGYFNPCGVFEVYDIDDGCPVAVGTVRKADEAWQIVAWMPLPKPYKEGDTT